LVRPARWRRRRGWSGPLGGLDDSLDDLARDGGAQGEGAEHVEQRAPIEHRDDLQAGRDGAGAERGAVDEEAVHGGVVQRGR